MKFHTKLWMKNNSKVHCCLVNECTSCFSSDLVQSFVDDWAVLEEDEETPPPRRNRKRKAPVGKQQVSKKLIQSESESSDSEEDIIEEIEPSDSLSQKQIQQSTAPKKVGNLKANFV